MFMKSPKDAVSFGREAVSLIKECIELFSPLRRSKRKYNDLIRNLVESKEKAFASISRDYHLCFYEFERDISGILTADDAIKALNDLKERRNSIVLARNELLGSLEGLRQFLQSYSPAELKVLVDAYNEYQSSLYRFFYATHKHKHPYRTSISDLLEEGYEAFSRHEKLDGGITLDAAKNVLKNVSSESKSRLEFAAHEHAVSHQKLLAHLQD